jgi:hypothetical protein
LCAAVLLAFYLLTYVFARDLSDKCSVFIGEMNATASAEGYLGFTNNALRQMFLDSKFPVLNGESVNYIENSINDMYWLVSGIQKEHSLNINSHNDIYI